MAIGCDRTVPSGSPVAAVPVDPWVAPSAQSEPAAELFAVCASCHGADGAGRSDGTVPRLAGQRQAVLVHKLGRLRTGAVTLPVMWPFARALTADEVTAVAVYASHLSAPVSATAPGVVSTAGAYTTHCAACHGLGAEGRDELYAPRLCGQHAAYIERRLVEISDNLRGDADAGMAAIVRGLDGDTRAALAAWLAAGGCRTSELP